MTGKRTTGVPARILAVFVAIATLSLLFGGATVYAQQATTATTVQSPPAAITTLTSGPGTAGSMPLWFAIQNNVETHAGNLQNNMFQYRINNASNDTVKAQIIEMRNTALQNAANNSNLRLQVMATAMEAHGATGEQYEAVIQLVNERINNTATYVNCLRQAVYSVQPAVISPAISQEIATLQDDVDEIFANAMQLRYQNFPFCHNASPVPSWNLNESWNWNYDWEYNWSEFWNDSLPWNFSWHGKQ